MRNYKTTFTSNEQTLAASTSFAVASANTFAAARRRFCESESSSVSASALIPVTNDDDACIEYKMLTSNVLLMHNLYSAWMYISHQKSLHKSLKTEHGVGAGICKL